MMRTKSIELRLYNENRVAIENLDKTFNLPYYLYLIIKQFDEWDSSTKVFELPSGFSNEGMTAIDKEDQVEKICNDLASKGFKFTRILIDSKDYN